MRTRVATVLLAGALAVSGLAACESGDDPGEPGRDESMLQPEPHVSGPSKALDPYEGAPKGSIGAPPGEAH